MRLLLMRHGVAEDPGPATDYRDEIRALTSDGVTKMRLASEGLKRLTLGVEEIISSPLVRCVQTAAIVGSALGLDATEDARLRPGTDLDAVADLLLEHPDTETILLCGHQPDMSQLVFDLTGGSVVFKKGTLAVIDVTTPRPNGAHLVALYPPATLRALAN